jgi:hemoglobin
MNTKTTVYDQIGGAPAVSAAVDGLYERILADPVLSHWFTATDMSRQKRHMRAFMATALGGAAIYAGRDMHAAHAGLHITGEAFDHVVGHLVDTLDSLGVPAEIIGAIGAKLAPLRAQVVQAPAQAA